MKTKPRDAIIMATKVSGPSHVWFKSPCRSGMTALDRKNIFQAIAASLTRLQTDYVDLYQTHLPHPDAPYDEMMDALHELVRTGTVSHPGTSHAARWGVRNSPARTSVM